MQHPKRICPKTRLSSEGVIAWCSCQVVLARYAEHNVAVKVLWHHNEREQTAFLKEVHTANSGFLVHLCISL